MIIILEGADGVGKTTLAKELAQRLDVPYWNRPESPLHGLSTDISQAMHETELTLLKTFQKDIVVDRFVPSEIVYNEHFGRDYDKGRAFQILTELKMSDDVLCICPYWPGDATDEQIDERTDDEVSVESIRQISESYFKLLDTHWHSALKFNCLKTKGDAIELAMRYIRAHRPTKDRLYMNLALEAARRSTCLSRRTGAVIVSAAGHVIATGYNGAPAGCAMQDVCDRLTAKHYQSGSSLDGCNDVHAEENAIIQAGLNGSTTAGGTIYTVNSPCHRCARMLINAGIKKVIYQKLYGDTRAEGLFKEAKVEMKEIDS